MNKNLTDIYLEAASGIFDGKDEFSCVAISRTQKDINCDAYFLYNTTMGKITYYLGRELPPSISVSDIERAINNNLKEARNFRVWLLCMMAACWEDMIE